MTTYKMELNEEEYEEIKRMRFNKMNKDNIQIALAEIGELFLEIQSRAISIEDILGEYDEDEQFGMVEDYQGEWRNIQDAMTTIFY